MFVRVPSSSRMFSLTCALTVRIMSVFLWNDSGEAAVNYHIATSHEREGGDEHNTAHV